MALGLFSTGLIAGIILGGVYYTRQNREGDLVPIPVRDDARATVRMRTNTR
jgi:hypothetical protein